MHGHACLVDFYSSLRSGKGHSSQANSREASGSSLGEPTRLANELRAGRSSRVYPQRHETWPLDTVSLLYVFVRNYNLYQSLRLRPRKHSDRGFCVKDNLVYSEVVPTLFRYPTFIMDLTS